MRRCRITVMRITEHRDLMEKYENPIKHACDMREGMVFITDGWKKPEGMCDSAWETLSPFVMTLAHGGEANLLRSLLLLKRHIVKCIISIFHASNA